MSDQEIQNATPDDPETAETAETSAEDTVEAEPTVAVDAVTEDGEAEPDVESEAEEAVADAEDEDKSPEVDDDEADPDEDLEPVESLGREETKQALHALLFASDRPVSADRLAEALGDIDREAVEMLVEELREQLEGQDVPYVLRKIAGGYQFTTKAMFGPYIRRLYEIKKKNRLSKSVLETLAIIAYKQPVTRPAVEAIRGVSVSHAFEILQEKRLIKVSGVAELPGRPKLYRTTDEFLAHFGMESLKGLPSIEEIREMG